MVMLFLFIILCLVTIVLFYSKIERFEDTKAIDGTSLEQAPTGTVPVPAAAPAGDYLTKTESGPIIQDKVNLVLTPIITNVNAIIDTMNDIPTKLYSKCVVMSHKIGSKIKEYAETMRSYHRSPDDEESLKTVAVNRRHKLYIDTIRNTKKDVYSVLDTSAKEFYLISFDDQEDKIMEILMLIGKYDSKVNILVKEKLQLEKE